MPKLTPHGSSSADARSRPLPPKGGASLLIGLGNPGKEYAKNRHNVGFMAVDAIAEHYQFSAWKKSKQALIAEGVIPPPVGGRSGGGHRSGDVSQNNAPLPSSPLRGEGKVILLKPQSYMNLSGIPAGDVARFYKIPVENILVFHDELDLPPGKLRVKRGGGNGGHNGLKSLDEHLGADYRRIRIGIGHPGDKDMVSDYVLSDFAKAEYKIAEAMVDETAKHIGLLLSGDEAGFMNKIAVAMNLSS